MLERSRGSGPRTRELFRCAPRLREQFLQAASPSSEIGIFPLAVKETKQGEEHDPGIATIYTEGVALLLKYGKLEKDGSYSSPLVPCHDEDTDAPQEYTQIIGKDLSLSKEGFVTSGAITIQAVTVESDSELRLENVIPLIEVQKWDNDPTYIVRANGKNRVTLPEEEIAEMYDIILDTRSYLEYEELR